MDADTRWGDSPQILIVDDEAPFAKRLKLAFQEAGYVAEALYDGVSALDFERKTALDLLILDLRMPNLDGADVLRFLRTEGNTLPVLLISGETGPRPEALTLIYENCHYLSKPCSYEQVVSRARDILAEPAAPVP